MGEDLVVVQRRGEVALEEVSGRDLSFSIDGTGDHRGPCCQADGGHLGRRVGVSDAADDGAAGANGPMADVGERSGHEWGVAGDGVGRFGGAMTNGGADSDAIGTKSDLGKLPEPTNVDDVGRGAKPQGHHRQQTLTTGQDLGVVAKLSEQGHRLAQRPWTVVLEWRVLHPA